MQDRCLAAEAVLLPVSQVLPARRYSYRTMLPKGLPAVAVSHLGRTSKEIGLLLLSAHLLRRVSVLRGSVPDLCTPSNSVIELNFPVEIINTNNGVHCVDLNGAHKINKKKIYNTRRISHSRCLTRSFFYKTREKERHFVWVSLTLIVSITFLYTFL